MLEKNKDYIEFSMHTMILLHKPYQEDTDIAISGMIPGRENLTEPNPFDVPCDVVMVPKKEFEQLQTENEQLKKKLEEFSPVPGYREFLTTLYPEGDIKKLVWATEQLCCGRDLRHVLQVDLEYYRALSSSQAKFNKAIFELIGFSSIEEIQDYLTNEAEADTLHEAILKLKDEVKYTCDEWYSANSSNNSWKAAAECNSPKELMEKIEGFETEIIDLKTKNTEYACKIQDLIVDSCGRKTVIKSYERAIEKWQKATGCFRPEEVSTCIDLKIYNGALQGAIQEWKEATGCPSPSAAKTLIESGMSWNHAYNEVKAANEKLADDVKSWKNVTGHSTPEDYLRSRINAAITGHTEWQKATYCDTPEDAKNRIETLNERIDESEACYNHLLMLTGFGDECEIEDALDKCDHSTLRKALVDYEFDYEALLKLTGYKSEHDIRVMLNDSEQFVYKNMRELINSLKRQLKFTDSNWQHATGCDTPGVAEERIKYYKNRLSNAVQAAGIAEKHLATITF